MRDETYKQAITVSAKKKKTEKKHTYIYIYIWSQRKKLLFFLLEVKYPFISIPEDILYPSFLLLLYVCVNISHGANCLIYACRHLCLT